MDLAEDDRYLRSQHNACLPIANLPYETITSIFELIVVEASDSITLVPITHVSQYWRQAAIEYPALWGYITGSTTSIELQSRSKDTPLFVQVSQGDLLNPRALKSAFATFLLLNAHRVRHISVDSPAWAIGAIARLLHTPPNLEGLQLRNSSFIVSATVTQLLNGQNSHLRELKLHALDIDWNGLGLSQLTSLEISSIHAEISDLLPALSQMQNLQHLFLFHCEQSINAATYIHHSDNIVYLPRLRRLRFRGSSNSCLPMFSHLDFPSSTSIELDIDDATTPPSITLFSMVMTKLFDKDCELRFKARDRSLQFSAPTRALEMDQVENLRSYALKGFQSFESVTSLHISTNALSIREEDWRHAFQLLRRLVTLELVFDICMPPVLRALKGSSEGTKIVLPALQVLAIKIFNIDVLEEEGLFQALLELLQGRSGCGKRLLELKMIFNDAYLRLAQDNELVQRRITQLGGLDFAPRLVCVDTICGKFM